MFWFGYAVDSVCKRLVDSKTVAVDFVGLNESIALLLFAVPLLMLTVVVLVL